MDFAAERFVYLVEDDEDVRDATLLLLESHGIVARGFATAGDFLGAFDPDMAVCVILDLHMPEMNGLELLEILRIGRVPTPVIAISGRRLPALDTEVKRAGAIAILSKPYHESDLITLIEEAAAR